MICTEPARGYSARNRRIAKTKDLVNACGVGSFKELIMWALKRPGGSTATLGFAEAKPMALIKNGFSAISGV